MTIGECVKTYCQDHGMSYRGFAKLTGLSSGYISLLISGRNPKTGRPITPDVETYVKLANGMGMTLDELFQKIDDSPVRVNYHSAYSVEISRGELRSPGSALDAALFTEFHEMSDEDKQDALEYIRFKRAQKAKVRP